MIEETENVEIKEVKSQIALKEGEEVCSNCKGTGIFRNYVNDRADIYICQKCGGAGKLNWIDNIREVNDFSPVGIDSSSSCFISHVDITNEKLTGSWVDNYNINNKK